jgi:hypothetical protein
VIERSREAELYESLQGLKPEGLLDVHPTQPLGILQTWGAQELAGVWDRETGKLVWAADGAKVACWAANGNEILLVKSERREAARRPKQIVTPLQSEISYSFERRAWPSTELICMCDLRPPTGWISYVTSSPIDQLAAYQWLEQDCAGFEFVIFDDSHAGEVAGAGYRSELSAISGPVFSPDGKHVVVGLANGLGWWSDEGDPDLESPGGLFSIGKLVIYNIAAQHTKEVAVEVRLEQGWKPHDTEAPEAEYFRQIGFSDPVHFSALLPTGERRPFEI